VEVIRDHTAAGAQGVQLDQPQLLILYYKIVGIHRATIHRRDLKARLAAALAVLQAVVEAVLRPVTRARPAGDHPVLGQALDILDGVTVIRATEDRVHHGLPTGTAAQGHRSPTDRATLGSNRATAPLHTTEATRHRDSQREDLQIRRAGDLLAMTDALLAQNRA